jgi:hypothetical protein
VLSRDLAHCFTTLSESKAIPPRGQLNRALETEDLR